MEALNKIRNQLNEFWQGIGKDKKIRLVLIGVLIIIIVAVLTLFYSTPKYQVLYANLDAKDAGEIRDKIKELKVPLKVDGTNILVPKDKVDELRITLAMEGLPRNNLDYPSMLKSEFNETSEDKSQKRLIYLQSVIENGIKALNGVEWAQVNLIIPPPDPFVIGGDDEGESSAGIIVKMKTGAQELDQNQVNGIVQWVCKSVSGLKRENVSIINDMGRALISDTGELGSQISTQMGMQEKIKNNLQKSVVKFLESVFGPNNVSVVAAVKLNFNEAQVNSTTYVPIDEEKKAGIVRNMEEITKEWVDANDGGIPGTDSNTDITQYVETDTSKAKYTEASSVINYDINETKEQIVREQGNIESLSISVMIDKEGLSEDALANIDGFQNEVRELVQYATQGLNVNNVEPDKNIIVRVMKFDTTIKDEIEAASKKAKEEKDKETMIMIGTAIAAVLVFAVALFMFVRRKKSDYETLSNSSDLGKYKESSQASIPIEDIGIEEKNEIKKRLEKFINQKPEQVATLLKSWLNEE